MEKTKIFISYKNRAKLLQNEILTPIQTGRAIADEVFEDMLGDDTGDNISKDNERYNELTAQYWVWKHYQEVGDPDYVGFMHYRRQFIFDPNLKHTPYLWLPKAQFYFVDHIYHGYTKHFTEDKISPHLEDRPDCIAYKKVDVSPVAKQINMKNHFYRGLPYQKKEVFEVFESVMNKDFLSYKNVFDEFTKGHHMYCCNSFVMPKELFFEYSEFLFSVLAKVDEKVDHSNFNTGEKRFLGFLGEYLLTIFLMQKLKNPEFKLKELNGTFVSKEYIKFKKKLQKYKLLLKLSLGKKRRHYLKQYCKYKQFLSGEIDS